MALELGHAYVTLLPSVDGFASKARASVARAMRGAGTNVGDQFGDEFTAAASRSTSNVGREIDKHTKSAAKSAGDNGAAGGKEYGQRFGNAAKLAIGAAMAGAGIAITAGLRDSINIASDAEQAAGAAESVFKGAYAKIAKDAKGAAKTVGLANGEYLQLATNLGAQLKNKGVQSYADETSKLMVKAADMAAMFGGTTAEAVDAINSALRGETDPIERYGASFNQAAIEAEALRMGLAKVPTDAGKVQAAVLRVTSAQDKYTAAVKEHGVKSSQARSAQASLLTAQSALTKAQKGGKAEMDDQAKSLAVLSLLNKQTADSVGTFAREADTYAGKMERARAATTNLKEGIGSLLLPVLSTMVEKLDATVTPALQSLVDGFKDGKGPVGEFLDKLRPLESIVQPLAVGIGVSAVSLTVYSNAARIAAWSTHLLSGAMRLLPFVAIGAAIAGLSAGLVWLYQNNETFRNGVTTAWNAIKTAVAFAWDGYIKPALTWFAEFMVTTWETTIKPALTWLKDFILNDVVPAVQRFWKETLQPFLTWFGNFITDVWETKVKPALSWLKEFITGTLVPVVLYLWHNVIKPAFTFIGQLISDAWHNVIKPVLSFLWSFIKNVLIPMILFLWRGVIQPAFQFIGTIIRVAWDVVIKPVLWALWQFIKFVLAPIVLWLWKSIIKPAFDTIGSIISTVWMKVIKPTLEALTGAMEKVPGYFDAATKGVKKAWDKLKQIALAPVEFVVVTVMNNGLIKGVNKLASSMGLGKTLIPDIPWSVGSKSSGGRQMHGVPKFAVGGSVPGWSPNDSADNIPAWLTAGEFVTRRASTRKMERRHPGVLEHINKFGELPRYARGGAVDSARPGPMMGGRTSPIRGKAPADLGVWRQMVTWLRQNIPGARVTSAYRRTMTATGKVSNHARGLAVDIVGSGRTSMMDIFNKIAAAHGGRSIELIHSQAGGRQLYRGRPHYYSGVTRANHFDHVHWSVPSLTGVPAFQGALDGGGGSAFNPFQELIDKWKGKLASGMPGGSSPFSKVVGAVPGKLMDGMGPWLADKAGAVTGFVGNIASDVGNALGRLTGNTQSIVQKVAGTRGWGSGPQWEAIKWIVGRESGWNPRAKNPRSTATGLFQFLNGTWAGTGYSKSFDPQIQAQAAMTYFAKRYGSPLAAQRFWQRNGYYADGGMVNPTLYDTGGVLHPGLTLVSNQTGKPETVRTFEQERSLQDTLSSGGGVTVNLYGVPMDNAENVARTVVRAINTERNRVRR